MKRLIVISFLFLSLTTGFSQSYKNSVGIRGGYSSGITFKHFVSSDVAYEGILGDVWYGGFKLTGLRINHTPALLDLANGFYFMSGYGLHVGAAYYDRNEEFFGYHHYYSYDNNVDYGPFIGIDGYLGLEYRIKEIPLVIGLDYKPFFEIAPHYAGINLFDLGLSLKFRF
ncbi:MAG: hypothetical protein Q8907_00650 [Bacteroidota bacterium]|nr:hypothetical protein [Bacteroidota bacterium]MDP4226423.1 hypothetical protein [Bacteroidota bacterium]MDP4272770.1 hypothetical protein [Bacteroidota bacterium]